MTYLVLWLTLKIKEENYRNYCNGKLFSNRWWSRWRRYQKTSTEMRSEAKNWGRFGAVQCSALESFLRLVIHSRQRVLHGARWSSVCAKEIIIIKSSLQIKVLYSRVLATFWVWLHLWYKFVRRPWKTVLATFFLYFN